MKSVCVFLLIFVHFGAALNSTRPMGKWIEAKWGKPVDKKPLKCGYISTCSQGYIVLLPEGGLPAHVRCIWAVAVPHATQYEVSVLQAEFMRKKNSGAGITINPVSFDETTIAEFYFEDVREPLVINAQTFLISFFTTGDYVEGGQGFILSYKVTASGNSSDVLPVTTNSEYHAVNDENSFYRHPGKTQFLQDEYDGRELSLITVIPKNNLVEPQVRMHLVYKRLVPTDLEIKCKQTRLYYHYFRVGNDGRGTYKNDKTFCEDTRGNEMQVGDLGFLRVVSLRRPKDPNRAFSLTYELEDSN